MASTDGPANLIEPFDALGRRTVRGWSNEHVAAALPGRRRFHSRRVHDDAWKTLRALSQYARDGILPIYPFGRASAEHRIPPAAISLIYPLYPAREARSDGRGLVELVDGSMFEAVADITQFPDKVRRDHRPLPRLGRPQGSAAFYDLAFAYWRANRQRVKPGVVLEHIETHNRAIFESVPPATQYRLVEQARAAAHTIAQDF